MKRSTVPTDVLIGTAGRRCRPVLSRRRATRIRIAGLAAALMLAASASSLNAGDPQDRSPRLDPIAQSATGDILVVRPSTHPGQKIGADGDSPPTAQPPSDANRVAPVAPAGERGSVHLAATGAGEGIPVSVLAAYQHAAATLSQVQPGCHLPMTLLAAIGKVESAHARGGRVDSDGNTLQAILGPVLDGGPGTAAIRDTDGGRYDGNTVWDRAVGPMQFIPGTWRRWATDGNADGLANPHNVYDATVASGRYLCADGRNLTRPADLHAAIYSYNHSTPYVGLVLAWMRIYEGGTAAIPDGTGPVGGDYFGDSHTGGDGSTQAAPAPGGAGQAGGADQPDEAGQLGGAGEAGGTGLPDGAGQPGGAGEAGGAGLPGDPAGSGQHGAGNPTDPSQAGHGNPGDSSLDGPDGPPDPPRPPVIGPLGIGGPSRPPAAPPASDPAPAEPDALDAVRCTVQSVVGTGTGLIGGLLGAPPPAPPECTTPPPVRKRDTSPNG